MFFVLIICFSQFGTEKNFINSFSNFLKVVQNHRKREKTKKNHFFPYPRGYPQDPDPHEDFCPDPDPHKNADPKPWSRQVLKLGA